MFGYTFLQWVMFFYIYCFIGWCIESTIVSLDEKRLVNRGFLRGPYLPLYGFGAIVILFVTLPFKENPSLVFLSGMTGTTILEYLTAVAMEGIFKTRYWDYSNYKFNFQGRISLLSSFFWGFLSLLLVYVIRNPIESLVFPLTSNHPYLSVSLTIIISVIFLSDTVYAIKTAFDVNIILDKLTRIKEETEVQLELLKEDINVKLDENERIANARLRLSELKAEYSETFNKIDFFRKSLITSHPSSISHKFNDTLKELRDKLVNKNK